MTGTERVAARLVSGQTSREVPGQAVSAGDGTHVQVQIGVQVWTATDLPKRPAAVGDMLTIRERQGSRQVVRNLTREANPPAAPTDVDDNADTGAGSSGITSSGLYDYTIGTTSYSAFPVVVPNVTEVRNYTRDGATVTRGLAGDLNGHDDVLADHGDRLNAIEEWKAQQAEAFNDLIAKLKTAGVIQ